MQQYFRSLLVVGALVLAPLIVLGFEYVANPEGSRAPAPAVSYSAAEREQLLRECLRIQGDGCGPIAEAGVSR
jgi:hypothetical protein